VVCEGEPVKFAFIAEMADEDERKPRGERFPVTFMCEMLEVSQAGYYAWRSRLPSGRHLDDENLTDLIKEIQEENKGRYGIDHSPFELSDSFLT
jgi:putative transposase